jgi:hypothetical protein
MTNAIPGTPHKGASWEQCIFASPMANNITGYKLVYWSHKELLKLILWGIGPPLWWDRTEEPFNQIYGSWELLLLLSI